MLEIPGERSVAGAQRQSRGRVQRLVVGAADGAHPRLGLRHAPVSQIELRIVAAGDPGVAAGAQQVRKLAPSVAAGRPFARHRFEFPELLAGLGVVGADVAAGFLIAVAAAHALDHLALNRSAVRWCCCILWTVSAMRVSQTTLPVRASSATKRSVGGGEINLVLIDRQAADRAVARSKDPGRRGFPKSARRSAHPAPARCCRCWPDT